MEENTTIITDKEREAAAKMGSIGGKKIVAKKGKKYMAKIGKKGGLNRWPKKVDKTVKKSNGKQRNA